MNFKNNLKAALKSRDMTAAQLSRRTGIPKTTIADWLSGGQPRDLNKLKLVADELALTLDELCFGESPTNRKIRLDDFKDEILAGTFEVVLRKAKTNKSES